MPSQATIRPVVTTPPSNTPLLRSPLSPLPLPLSPPAPLLAKRWQPAWPVKLKQISGHAKAGELLRELRNGGVWSERRGGVNYTTSDELCYQCTT